MVHEEDERCVLIYPAKLRKDWIRDSIVDSFFEVQKSWWLLYLKLLRHKG